MARPHKANKTAVFFEVSLQDATSASIPRPSSVEDEPGSPRGQAATKATAACTGTPEEGPISLAHAVGDSGAVRGLRQAVAS